MINRHAKGKRGEDEAVDFLKKKGYAILERNYRYERGEIDIIARDNNNMLVFIEVKARQSRAFGDPEDAVTLFKVGQIRKVAEGYLFARNIADRDCRFDLIAIIYENENNETVIRHIEDAF